MIFKFQGKQFVVRLMKRPLFMFSLLLCLYLNVIQTTNANSYSPWGIPAIEDTKRKVEKATLPPKDDCASEFKKPVSAGLSGTGYDRYKCPDDNKKKKALHFLAGWVVIKGGDCSNSVAYSDVWKKAVFLSAQHCIGRTQTEISFDIKTGGSTVGLSDGRQFRLSDAVVDKDMENDLIATPVPDEKFAPCEQRSFKVLKVAKTQPRSGDKIYLHGFPGRGIPGAAYHAPYSVIECTYLGPTFKLAPTRNIPKKEDGPSPELNRRAMVVQGLGRCEVKAKSGLSNIAERLKLMQSAGFSGGSILNAQGELVGTHSGSNKITVDQDGGKSGAISVVFSPISDDLLAKDPKVVRGERLLPKESGTVRHKNMVLHYETDERVVKPEQQWGDHDFDKRKYAAFITGKDCTLNYKDGKLHGKQRCECVKEDGTEINLVWEMEENHIKREVIPGRRCLFY